MQRKGIFEMNWDPIKQEIPSWFRNAKFGLFFHWGPYCVPAFENEWYSRNMYVKGSEPNKHHVGRYGGLDKFGYKDFYRDFKGEKFDPEFWADLIVKSGAKYAGPVSEHTDNFSLWNSKVNPINSVNYGPKRDVVGEMAAAIRNRGLKFLATFHHQWLWGWFMSTDPDADVYLPGNEKYYGKALPLETIRYIPNRFPDKEFNDMWLGKVIELVNNYSPDLVYFDSRTFLIEETYRYKIADYIYRKNAIISYKEEDFPKGVGIVDLERGQFNDIVECPWQTDDRLENTTTWSYIEGVKYKSAASIIHQLADIVSKNGNLLLNVGPKADGSFADEAISVLYEIGDWLRVHGEAIYKTRPFKVYGEELNKGNKSSSGIPQSQIRVEGEKSYFKIYGDNPNEVGVRFTTRDNNLYAILTGNIKAKKIFMQSLKLGVGLASNEIKRIDIIGGVENIPWKCDELGLTVQLRSSLPSSYANVLKIIYR